MFRSHTVAVEAPEFVRRFRGEHSQQLWFDHHFRIKHWHCHLTGFPIFRHDIYYIIYICLHKSSQSSYHIWFWWIIISWLVDSNICLLSIWLKPPTSYSYIRSHWMDFSHWNLRACPITISPILWSPVLIGQIKKVARVIPAISINKSPHVWNV